MSHDTPLLIIAYNRPEKLRQLISSLRSSRPGLILVAVDGPKANRALDTELVAETQRVCAEIDWPAVIETRFRVSNLGLRIAYIDAVSWALDRYGRTIVIEDDVVSGPQFYGYMRQNLDKYQENNKVAQINGYNFVPPKNISHPAAASRLTSYPTSYAWATWARSWALFDHDLEWGINASLRELRDICGSYLAAINWKLNFLNAKSGRVDTWDYYWVASMWKHGLVIVAPNRNLTHYDGFENGTHTRRRFRPSPSQLPIQPIELTGHDIEPFILDCEAEQWTSRHVFRASVLGVGETAAASVALEFIRRRRAHRAGRQSDLVS